MDGVALTPVVCTHVNLTTERTSVCVLFSLLYKPPITGPSNPAKGGLKRSNGD